MRRDIVVLTPEGLVKNAVGAPPGLNLLGLSNRVKRHNLVLGRGVIANCDQGFLHAETVVGSVRNWREDILSGKCGKTLAHRKLEYAHLIYHRLDGR